MRSHKLINLYRLISQLIHDLFSHELKTKLGKRKLNKIIAIVTLHKTVPNVSNHNRNFQFVFHTSCWVGCGRTPRLALVSLWWYYHAPYNCGKETRGSLKVKDFLAVCKHPYSSLTFVPSIFSVSRNERQAGSLPNKPFWRRA